MRGRWELSDAQWELIEPVLRPKRRPDGRGRPWRDTRAVLDGVLWVLGPRRVARARRLIGDKAYDSDRQDHDLAERYGLEMIAPHRGQRRTPTQDGRPLRRYRKR